MCSQISDSSIHILGIGGTFMGSLAILAREMGYQVTGTDKAVYPPMSTQLEKAGIAYTSPHQTNAREPVPVQVIGNALSRGNPAVEEILNNRLPYTSGPQWLGEKVLADKWVLAVSGTHGKTTTASMLAWILEYANMSPGFLIGGVPANFGVSARLGDTPFFVVEADEYDTAFFDKRSKFVHYKPRTLIINNIEFDHADIFENLSAIQKQFHHLIRLVPSEGLIIHPANCENVNEVVAKGCWSAVETFGDNGLWSRTKTSASGFNICYKNQTMGELNWDLMGEHNKSNALAAIAAARHVGVPVSQSIEALGQFKGVARRMQLRGEINNIRVYDDFAHHPTAIATTVAGLREVAPERRLIAVLEPASNTMKMGVHQTELAGSLSKADEIIVYQSPQINWDVEGVFESISNATVFKDHQLLVERIVRNAQPGDDVLMMSNGGFNQAHQKVVDGLSEKYG